MKKLKIMLLSFAILAVVGSALAFKARFGNTDFCTTTTVAASGDFCVTQGAITFCPDPVVSTTVNKNHGDIGIWCTTTARDLDNDGDKECFGNIGGSQTTLPCLESKRLYID
jgi:hypothetical protein